MTPRPLWRWWLFCAATSLWFRFRWRWALALLGWCVRREWVSDDADCAACASDDGGSF